MILYVLPFLIVNYRQMLNERAIVLFALLSTFQVSISESRSILPLTTESDAVRRHDGEPAERRTDESSNDLVKMDGIELAVALGIRQSAATQPCKPSSFCNLNSNYKFEDCINLATCIVEKIVSGTAKRRVKVVEDCVNYRKCQYSCPQFLDNYFTSLWCLIVEKSGTKVPKEACTTIMKQKTS